MLTIDNLSAYWGNKRFWTDMIWLTEQTKMYPKLEKGPLSLPVDDRCWLQLDMDEELALFSLLLATDPEEEGEEIAWHDEAHPHPYALRLEEWQHISAAIAQHRDYTGPAALPSMLLHRFVGVTDEQWPLFEQLVRDAFRSLDLFADEELDAIVTHVTRNRSIPLEWVYEQGHWYAVGDDAYSLRNRGNDTFPHAILEQAGRSSS